MCIFKKQKKNEIKRHQKPSWVPKALYMMIIAAIFTCGIFMLISSLEAKLEIEKKFELSALAMFIPTRTRYMAYKWLSVYNIGKNYARICDSYRDVFLYFENVQ